MPGRPLVHALLRLLERAPRPSPQRCVGMNTTPAPQSEPVPQAPRLVAHDAPSVAIGPGLSIPAAGPAHWTDSRWTASCRPSRRTRASTRRSRASTRRSCAASGTGETVSDAGLPRPAGQRIRAPPGAAPAPLGLAVLAIDRIPPLPLSRNPRDGGGTKTRRAVQRPQGPRPQTTRLPNATRQELSELREGHVLRDETFTAAGEAFRRPVPDDAPAPAYGLDVAAAAALLARSLDGHR